MDKIFETNTFSNSLPFPETDLRVSAWRGAPSLFFAITCFLCNHFEKLQIALFKVELIINNASSTYVYPKTIEKCLTPNHFYLADGYSILLTKHLLIRGESHIDFCTQSVIMTLGLEGGLSLMTFWFWNSEKLSNFKTNELHDRFPSDI